MCTTILLYTLRSAFRSFGSACVYNSFAWCFWTGHLFVCLCVCCTATVEPPASTTTAFRVRERGQNAQRQSAHSNGVFEASFCPSSARTATARSALYAARLSAYNVPWCVGVVAIRPYIQTHTHTHASKSVVRECKYTTRVCFG